MCSEHDLCYKAVLSTKNCLEIATKVNDKFAQIFRPQGAHYARQQNLGPHSGRSSLYSLRGRAHPGVIAAATVATLGD